MGVDRGKHRGRLTLIDTPGLADTRPASAYNINEKSALYELIDDPRCDQQFLVMECVRGWTLQRPVARRESIPEEDLRHWLREARGAEGRGGSASAAAHPPPALCFRSTSAWSTCTSTESLTETSSQADADRESAHPLHPPRRNLPKLDRQTPL